MFGCMRIKILGMNIIEMKIGSILEFLVLFLVGLKYNLHIIGNLKKILDEL